eukprot:symbB.v1.2.035557.t1/scaffold4818.1/size34747/1
MSEVGDEGREHTLGAAIGVNNLSGSLAFLLANLVSLLIHLLPREEQLAWAWRVAFLLALPLGVASILLRRHVPETEAFRRKCEMEVAAPSPSEEEGSPLSPAEQKSREVELQEGGSKGKEQRSEWIRHLHLLLLVVMVLSAVNSCNYLPIYLVSWLEEEAELSPSLALSIAALAKVVQMLMTFPVSFATDRYGTTKVMLLGGCGVGLGAVPLLWLVMTTSVQNWPAFLMLGIVLPVLISIYLIPSNLFMTCVFPTPLRARGCGLCLGLASVTGGLTPMIASQLAEKGELWPGAFISFLTIPSLAVLCQDAAIVPLPIDREIQQLRDEARVRDHQRNLQIQELQNMIQQQAVANSKLQQMLESSLRIPANVHPVQSETAATASTDPLANQTAKSPPMTAPPGIAPIGLANVHGFQFDIPNNSAAGTNPVIISDPVSGTPILVSKTDQRLTAAPINPVREFRLGESGMDMPEPTTPNQSPAPSVKHYAMFPSGGGGGGGGGGDGDGDGSNFDPDRDKDLFGFPSYPKRDGRKPGAPGGGGGGGPDDSDSEDSDDKFARKLRKFMKSSRDHDASDEKSKVKEADTIKVPAFPTPESYRNWRIKTREAVVAASTKPDEAFRWVNEAWKEGQSLEALRKVEPSNTLDAKLMSALTNVITGHFARIVDTFKENGKAGNSENPFGSRAGSS